MARAEKKERGLYQNGGRYWMRVDGVRRSTGTSTLKVANRVLKMVRTLESEHIQRDLLRAARDGSLPLIDLYDAYVMGQFTALRAEIARKATPDVDLEPLVERWDTEHLAGRTLAPLTRRDYVKQVRALFPAGVPFPASQLTEERVTAALLALPVTDSTKRRYAAAWRLFTTFARRRVKGIEDPFAFSRSWLPKNGASRTTFWSYAQTMDVLDRMSGEPRRAMALMFGTGLELSALRNLEYRHLISDRTIVAPGTKNAHRQNRTILVDAWAAAIFRKGLTAGFPTQRVFTFTDKELRQAFYTAQSEAKLIGTPKRSSTTRKLLWGDVVGLHRLHDCRHSYALVRLLGSDGEPPRTLKFVAQQLGHATEQMLIQVYAKANIEARHDLALEEVAAGERRYNSP